MGGKACLPLSGCPSHLPWERHLWDKEKRGCNVCAEHTFPLQSGERGAHPSIFLLQAGGGPGAWGWRGVRWHRAGPPEADCWLS